MAKFEPRDLFLTSAGFYPTSDTDSGGLSDPAFERYYAALPNLDDLAAVAPHQFAVSRLGLVASAVALVLMLALLFFPEAVGSIVAR